MYDAWRAIRPARMALNGNQLYAWRKLILSEGNQMASMQPGFKQMTIKWQ